VWSWQKKKFFFIALYFCEKWTNLGRRRDVLAQVGDELAFVNEHGLGLPELPPQAVFVGLCQPLELLKHSRLVTFLLKTIV